MGAYQVVFSDYASADLEQIVRYIARDNPEAARRCGDHLLSRALALKDALVCQSGGPMPKRPGIRKLVEGNYLILYRILPDQNKVRVLRFWHGARNPQTLRLDG